MMELDPYLEKLIDPAFERYGYRRVKGARKWVNSSAAPIRKMVELLYFRGWTYILRWGYCVDFVPKYTRQGFKWKKTERSCELDLCIDPIDELGTLAEWCSIPGEIGYQFNEGMFEPIASEAIPTIVYDMKSVATITELLEEYEQRLKIQYRRFHLKNYPQTKLTMGILYKILGNHEVGETHLSYYRERWKMGDELNDVIEKSIEMARAIIALK